MWNRTFSIYTRFIRHTNRSDKSFTVLRPSPNRSSINYVYWLYYLYDYLHVMQINISIITE